MLIVRSIISKPPSSSTGQHLILSKETWMLLAVGLLINTPFGNIHVTQYGPLKGWESLYALPFFSDGTYSITRSPSDIHGGAAFLYLS